MQRPASLIVEIAATALLGIMGGFFFAFAVDVAPAMAHLDATAYITTQQWINRVVRNALFGSVYFGSALLPFAAAGLAVLARRWRIAAAWLVLALAYFAAVFWITRSINVPINNELAAWDPRLPPAHWTAARDDWNRANDIRAGAAFVCFVGALVIVATRRRDRHDG